MSLQRRKKKLANIKHEYVVIKTSGTFPVDKEKNIYQLELKTGMILKADLVQQENDSDNREVFKLIEKPMHVYLPALSKEEAKILFNRQLGQAHSQKRK